MIDKREILRYIGAKHADEQIDEMIERAWDLVTSSAKPKHVYQLFPISVMENYVEISGTKIQSKSLAGHLVTCNEAYLFACTLGAELDILIKRYSISDMPLVPVLQACAAVFTEYCADKAQELIERDAAKRNLYMRPRYSPGYGDFSLNYQRFLFETIDVTKNTGITLTDTYMMVPTKSVSAIIGLTVDSTMCHVGKCMACSSAHCPFRKEKKYG